MCRGTALGRRFARSILAHGNAAQRPLCILAFATLLLPVCACLAHAADGSSPLDIFIKSYIDEWGKPPTADPKHK